MYLSTLLTSLPFDFATSVPHLVDLGFTHVDPVAVVERRPSDCEALAESGLFVGCAALGKNLGDGNTLDAADVTLRRRAVEQVERHVADAANLGATCGYLVPGLDGSTAGLARFADSCTTLADFATRRMVRLCIEAVPGKALGRADETLAWIDGVGHPNLALLLDVGHCLLSSEDPAKAIERVGDRLGWIHVDDNDGIGDLHLPLLAGLLTEESLGRTLAALHAVGYAGGLTLELRPDPAAPLDALRQGKDLLERLLSLLKDVHGSR